MDTPSTTRPRRPSGRIVGIVLLVAGMGILAASGCHIFRLGGPERPAFSHRFHVVEKKLDCADCHADYEESDEAGMPFPEICEPCHSDLDKGKPPLERASALFPPEGEPAWTLVTKLPEEVIFSHRVHHEKKVECSECHRGVSESEAVSSRLAIGKPECMDCHARRGASNECAVCHQTIRKDVAPESHGLAWMRTHGQAVRSDRRTRSDCSLCHAEASCSSCHQEVPPQNHTNFWRQRGHGVAAAMDRDNCKACHQADYCERCHREVEPRSHMGTFASTMQTHCLSCHAPLSGESCGVCHRGTPSHFLATLPPSHNPGMNCRQCHGVGEPLPHVDNGDSCISCHR
jgi:hypothetical protein